MIYHYTTLKNLQKMWHPGTQEEPEKTEDIIHYVDRSYCLLFNANDVRKMNAYRENALIYQSLQNGASIDSRLPSVLGNVYAISFCKKKDYIPMWNLHPHNDSDVCICLGFSADKKKKKVKDVNKAAFTELKLDNCQYATESEMQSKISIEVQELKRLASSSNAQNPDKLNRKLKQVMLQSAFYRLEDFKYENETRLVGFIDKDRLMKEGRYGTATCRQIKMPLTLLKEIIIGPRTRNEDVIQIGIEGLLARSGLYSSCMKYYGIEIKVELSKLKLR